MDCKKKTSPNRRERPLIRKTGWGTTERERERERHMGGKREKRGVQCYMKKEDNSLIDVENGETTGERCRHLSGRTPLNSSLCTVIGMKLISPTFMYIIPMYQRLTTFTKNLPHMSFPPMTLLTAGPLTDPRLRTIASNVYTTDASWVASAGCPPPKQKSWLRHWKHRV